MQQPRKFTREESKRMTAYEKSFGTPRRLAAKQCGWKTRSWCVYKTDGPYFFSSHITLAKPAALDGTVRLNVVLSAKLLVLDDLFWEIFRLEENKTAPAGLRGNGAFTVKGPELLRHTLQTNLPPTEENMQEACVQLLQIMQKEIDLFKQKKYDIGTFEEFIETEPQRLPGWLRENYNPHRGDGMLVRMLLYILQGNPQRALALARQEMAAGHKGMYSNSTKNGSKYIYEYIIDYCEKHPDE